MISLRSFHSVGALHSLPRISFAKAFVIQLLDRPEKPIFFGGEEIVAGDWEKYNSNDGYVAPNPSPLGVDHSAVQAFSHWIHYATAGRLLMVDCQGSYDPRTNSLRWPTRRCGAVSGAESLRLHECEPGGHGLLFLHAHLQRLLPPA